MFAHDCTACGKRQLIFTNQVTSLLNVPQGILVTHTCWCGAEQSWLTGKAVTERAQVAIAA